MFETLLDDERIARETGAGYWAGRLITDFLDDYAQRTPDKIAFVDAQREITFAQLKLEVDRLAGGFLAHGIRRGDVVAFQLPNCIEWIVVHYAITRVGAVSTPLIPIYREREVGFMVGLSKARIVIVPKEFRGFDYPAMIERLQPQWEHDPEVVVVGEQSWTDLAGTTVPDAEELEQHRPAADDVTLLIFTSGTTGEPKGVMHTHNTMVAANAPLPDRLGITSDSVFHMASTLAHLTGFLYGARLGVQNGATCVLQEVWDPARFVELVEQYGITYTSAATPFLHDLLTAPNLDEHDTSSLVRFCCMGAPIPRVMVRQAKQTLPRLAVLGGWGQTEEGLVTLGIPGDPEDKIIETDGYPWPGMQIRVVDPATGEPVAAGSEGALQVRGPFLFVGYADRLELTRQQMRPADDGNGDWFDTGDLAYVDEDGYLRISGRTKDVIIRGGENIPVAYVENVLYEHPDLDLVALVAIPDDRLQERACACVVMRPGADEITLSGIQEFLTDKGVAKQYWPERLLVLDDFPKTPSGKIQKFQLRETAANA